MPPLEHLWLRDIRLLVLRTHWMPCIDVQWGGAVKIPSYSSIFNFKATNAEQSAVLCTTTKDKATTAKDQANHRAALRHTTEQKKKYNRSSLHYFPTLYNNKQTHLRPVLVSINAHFLPVPSTSVRPSNGGQTALNLLAVTATSSIPEIQLELIGGSYGHIYR